MSKIVNVIDAVCGIGKTSSLINHINESDNDEKFLYITPFLTEVERIKKECSVKNFKDPEIYGTKLNGINFLFSKGENIVSTHALFRLFNEEIMELVYLNNYTLVMDEVANVVEVLPITSYDLNTLLEKYVEVDEQGTVKWIASDYEGRFEDYKRLCDLGCLTFYGNGGNKTLLLWMFPVNVFKSFKSIYILTYLFDAQIQKYYYDYYNIEYNYLYVNNYRMTNDKMNYKNEYKNLINICSHEKLNRIGELNGALSSTWFDKNKNSSIIEILKNNTYNYFRNIAMTSSELNMWTTFKEYKDLVKGKGYAKGFVSLNARATNNYINKCSIAYLANRYLNPIVKNFFISKNIDVNEDMFALSELLQFAFRSRLREKKDINIYLPSERMRKILFNWLESDVV